MEDEKDSKKTWRKDRHDIKHATRKQYLSEEKIRNVLGGLRVEGSIA